MEVFISYRFTGENLIELDTILWNIRDSLSKIGLDTFCSLWLEEYFRENNMSVDEIYDYCTNRLSGSDIFFAFIKSEEESRWMKMELDEAIKLNKKVVVAIKQWLNHDIFRTNASKIIEYKTYEDLYNLLNSPNLLVIQ